MRSLQQKDMVGQKSAATVTDQLLKFQLKMPNLPLSHSPNLSSCNFHVFENLNRIYKEDFIRTLKFRMKFEFVFASTKDFL